MTPQVLRASRGRRACLVALITTALATVLSAPAQASGPVLHVSILDDAVTAVPGGVVRYAVLVENTGDADAGLVRVTSSYPEHTTAASQSCPEGALEPDGDVCLDVDLPTPGAGDRAHQVNHNRAGLPAGASFMLQFAVRVDDDAPLGSHLLNHAHASSASASEVSSAPVDTLVVGTVPHALFADRDLALSGQAETGGWDPPAGTLSQTREAGGGDVASNGDIILSGGSLVDGDATPGPGRQVFLTDTARVTGSVAAAAAPVVLNGIDAAPYATNNDNRRLCRAPQSCQRAAYDEVSKSFVVTGSAVLPTGAYYLCRLEVRGTLTITGRATIWLGASEACAGQEAPVLLESEGSVAIASGRATDLQIRVASGTRRDSTVRVASSSSYTGVLYAPSGRLVLEGKAQLLGRATVGSALVSGDARVYVERALRD